MRKIGDETIFFTSGGRGGGDGMVENEGSFEDRGREGEASEEGGERREGKLEILQIWDFWSKTGAGKRF